MAFSSQLEKMFLLFVLTTNLHISYAQETDVGFAVDGSRNPLTDQCTCRVHVPDTIQCAKVTNPATIVQINNLQNEVSRVSLRLDNQVTAIQAQTATIDSVSVTLATSLATLQRIEAGTMVVSRPELIQIRKEIQDMEALLVTLQSNRTSNLVIGRLQTEIINVTTLLNELELNENADTSDLLEQITNLRAKVDECKNAEIPSSLYDVWEEDGTQDSCANLVAVSLPYTVTGLRSLYGAWFRDPVKFPRRVYSYEMPNGRYSNIVKYYGSLKDYHDGNDAVEIRLADSSQGTGLVAFNGSIYYNAYNSRNVAKFDVVSNQKLVFKALDDASYNNALPYRSAAYSDIDLLADQLGLWAVYSSTAANGFILISKLDQDTLEIMKTWRTNYPKSAAGNCFVACGVVYCTNGFDSHINKINYKFDTKSEKEEFLNIPFDNKFLKTYSLNYNARDQKLYGWDNGHQMIYDLFFSNEAPTV